MLAAWCLVLFLLCVTKKVHTTKSPPATTVSMNRRQSFVEQFHAQHNGAQRRASTYEQRLSLAEAVGSQTDKVTAPFQSNFAPTEMRQLALVAHNHMKPAMKQFIETYSEILKKFRITGTQTTMKMCKSMWGEDDPAINYGLTCTSGPLGGDAQIAALMYVWKIWEVSSSLSTHYRLIHTKPISIRCSVFQTVVTLLSVPTPLVPHP